LADRVKGTAPASAGCGPLAAPLPRGGRRGDHLRARLCRLLPRRPHRQRLPGGGAGPSRHDRKGD